MPASIKSPRIRRLSPVLVDKIAAGEVIEGPHSVIKELAENSLDAGATRLRMETRAGGLASILVEDDGSGIHTDDLVASVQRHATSKIGELEDLDEIASFGFRGEALASIASVAHVEIRSRQSAQDVGGRIECRGGELIHTESVACNPGTVIKVSELFYATPARRKFVKSERTENARIYQAILRLALAHPDVRFEYYRDGKEYLNLPPQELSERVAQVYRSQIIKHLIAVEGESQGLRLRGWVTDEGFFRANRDGQFQYINGRYVEIKNFSYFVKKAYGELLPPGSHPYFFLFLEIDPRRVDVNVHPAKREVRLLDESLLHGLIVNSISSVLRPHSPLSFGRYAPDAPGKVPQHANRDSLPPRLSHYHAEQAGEFLIPRPPAQRPTYSIEIDAPREVPGATAPLSALDQNSLPSYRTGSATSAASPSDPRAGEGAARESGAGSFLPRRHFGVLYGTYILAEGDDGLYIIDQHTAHERINYEKMRRKLEAMRGQRQALLHPITVDCLPDELAGVLAASGELLESGFLVEEFGPAAYIVREIPPYLEPGSETELILHLIHRVLEGEEQVRLYDEYAAMKACKASIKRNDHVSGEVLSEILKELAQCEQPARCPHGRPTMLRITPGELDRMFHRA